MSAGYRPGGSGGGVAGVASVDGSAGAVDLTSSYEQLNVVSTIKTSANSPITAAVGNRYTLNIDGNIAVNLPSAPLNNKRMAFHVSAVAGSFTATLTCGGTDRFTTPSTGPTTMTLNRVGQVTVLQYHAASGIWLVEQVAAQSLVPGYATTPNTAVAGDVGVDVQVDVQEFGSAGAATGGTWTKPSWATASSEVIVEVVGAGGQGGTGRRGAAGTLRCGGGGGQAGFRSRAIFKAGDLPATVTVNVGGGGTSANNATTDDTDGQAGVSGGISKFGAFVVANGGGGGQAGNNTAGGAGGTTVAGVRGLVAGAPGVQGSDTTTKDPDLIVDGVWGAGVLSKNVVNGGGGGGGAGISAANANVIGSRGGDVDGYGDGTVQGGAAGVGALGGSTGNTADAFSASGGGGGGRANGANALAGGTGGFPGGGGGGGGAALNGFQAGIGGTGGNGFVRITTRP